MACTSNSFLKLVVFMIGFFKTMIVAHLFLSPTALKLEDQFLLSIHLYLNQTWTPSTFQSSIYFTCLYNFMQSFVTWNHIQDFGNSPK